MSLSKYRNIYTGLKLIGQASIAPASAGEIRYNSSTNRLQIYDTALRNITTDDGTQTLTNKTLSGNTAVTLISSSGTLILNTSGTVTLPNATDTLVGKATTDVLTNKTLDAEGTGNSLTNVKDANIKAGAGIARSKLAAGSANHVVINDGSGNFSSEAALAISRGGTGQATAIAGFNALSPMTTKGDIIGYSNTGARLAVGTDGQVLTADSSETLGIKWATNPSAPDQSYEINNLTLTATVDSSALTIALKNKAGDDPSAGDPVKVGFRDATSANGTYVQRTIANALDITVSSGSTLGHESGKNEYIYVYLIDNAGTVQLAVSSSLYDEGSIQSSTDEAGNADSRTLLYTDDSVGVISNKAIRLVGRILSNQATAGTWDSAISEISLVPFETYPTDEIYLTGGSGHGSSATAIRRFTTITTQWGTALSITQSSTNGDVITINKTGVYSITYVDSSSTQQQIGIGLNTSGSGTTSPASLADANRLSYALTEPPTSGNQPHLTVFCGILRQGDEIRCHTSGVNGTSTIVVYFRICRIA